MDGIDLSADSGSTNKQPATGFKDEETHLYFSLRAWISELGRHVAPDRWRGHNFLTSLASNPVLLLNQRHLNVPERQMGSNVFTVM